MIIRPATLDDLEAIKKLSEDIFDALNATYTDDHVPNFAFTQEGEAYFVKNIIRNDGCFLVVEEAGALIGFSNAFIKTVPYWKSRYVEIENVGVLAEKQHQHIGSQLLEAVTEWAKAQGCVRLYLNCYIKNINAIDFYKHFGYQPIDVSFEKVIE